MSGYCSSISQKLTEFQKAWILIIPAASDFFRAASKSTSRVLFLSDGLRDMGTMCRWWRISHTNMIMSPLANPKYAVILPFGCERRGIPAQSFGSVLHAEIFWLSAQNRHLRVFF
jgi:hypothetical protein